MAVKRTVDIYKELGNKPHYLELNMLELFECKTKPLQCSCPLSVNKTEGKIICKRCLGRLLDNLQIVSQRCVVKKSVKT